MHDPGLTPTSERDIALLQLGSLLRARGYHFITPTPLTHARVNARPSAALAGDLRDVFGWNRPFPLELLDEPLVAAMHAAQVLQPCGDLWRSRVRWSSLDEQLYLHAGFPTKQADAVFFGPDTYRFVRLLKAHLAQERQPVRRIADIGCGSGAGAICAALARPQAEVLALDINPEALAFTTINARLAGLFNLQALHSDLLRDVDGQFDLIIANPPYMLDPLRRTYRHGGGRHGGGLSLAIFDTALERLAPGGTLLLYSGVAIVKGEDSLLNVISLSLRDTGWDWHYEEIDPDVFGEELQHEAYAEVERIACVALRLTCRP